MSDSIQTLSQETATAERLPYVAPVLIDLSVNEMTAHQAGYGADGGTSFGHNHS